jgi:hypothetical protein
MYTTFESPRDHGMPLVTRTPQALKRGRRDLPNRVTTSFTSVRTEADRVGAPGVRQRAP